MSVKKKPLVVVTRKLPDSIETRMRELFDARLNLDDTPMTPEQSLVEGENSPVMPGSLESRGPSLGTLLVLFSGGAACPNGPNEVPCFVDRHGAPGG